LQPKKMYYIENNPQIYASQRTWQSVQRQLCWRLAHLGGPVSSFMVFCPPVLFLSLSISPFFSCPSQCICSCICRRYCPWPYHYSHCCPSHVSSSVLGFMSCPCPCLLLHSCLALVMKLIFLSLLSLSLV
jgi:hypothetical protein